MFKAISTLTLLTGAVNALHSSSLVYRKPGSVGRVRPGVAQGDAAPHVEASAGLKGELGYITFEQGGDYTLELALWDLFTNTSTDMYNFSPDYLESSYVEGSVISGDTWFLSLQYDADEDQGCMVVYDIAKRSLIKTFNSTFCYGLFVDAVDNSTLHCLSLQLLPNGTQATFLHNINWVTQKDTSVAFYLPDYAPYTVDTYDPKHNTIYNSAAPLNGNGANVLNVIDAKTGQQVALVSYQESTAFIELEWSNGRIYSVVEMIAAGGSQVFFGTVDPATATATPVGSANFSYFGQLNTISTISPAANGGRGVMFSTAFHYITPTQPQLYMLGNDLSTGAFVYMTPIQNPFCDIEYHALPA